MSAELRSTTVTPLRAGAAAQATPDARGHEVIESLVGTPEGRLLADAVELLSTPADEPAEVSR